MAKDKTTAPAKSAAAAASPKKKRSVVKYFKDARSEFKKVVWPSRKQVFNNTFVVLVALVVSGIAIWALDTGFGSLLMLMLGKNS
ncbi:MAG: preprotein translocase subunit SecE [Lachnospiraceae bacterium]|nr:preprotein translocase subunit SecE [Lachnospiraceae bacterium]